jgi:putative salt-induced outer membrane protein
MNGTNHGNKPPESFRGACDGFRGSLALLLAGLVMSLTTLTGMAQGEPAPAEAPAGAEVVKKPAWEKSASIGFTLTDGNSDTLLGTGDIQGLKKWEKNELSLNLSGAYGKNGGDKNNETVRGFAQYNRLLNERTYFLGRQEGYYDSPADVHYRFITSLGVGYYFIKHENASLSGEVGPGFIAEKQGDNETQYFTARLAERYDRKLNERAKFWQTAELLPKVDDPETYLFNFELGVETSLTQTTNLRAVFQDFYNNKPAEGREHNDIKLITSLVMKF